MNRTTTAPRRKRRAPPGVSEWRSRAGLPATVPDNALVVLDKAAGWFALWRGPRNQKSTETIVDPAGEPHPWSEITSTPLRNSIACVALRVSSLAGDAQLAGRFIYETLSTGKGWHLAWRPTPEAWTAVAQHRDYEFFDELPTTDYVLEALLATMPWPEIDRAYTRWIGRHSRTDPILLRYDELPIAELGQWDDRIALGKHDAALLDALWPWIYGTHQQIGLLLGLFGLEYGYLSQGSEPVRNEYTALTKHGTEVLAHDPAGVMAALDGVEYAIRPRYSSAGSHLVFAAAVAAGIPVSQYSDNLPALRLLIGEDAIARPLGMIVAPSLRLVSDEGIIADIPKPLALPIVADDKAPPIHVSRHGLHEAMVARLTGLHPSPVCVIALSPNEGTPQLMARLPGVHRAVLLAASTERRSNLWVGGPAVTDSIETRQHDGHTWIRYRSEHVVPALERVFASSGAGVETQARPAFVLVRERQPHAFRSTPIRTPADVLALLRAPDWPRSPSTQESIVWLVPIRNGCLDAAGPIRAPVATRHTNVLARALQTMLLADVSDAVVVEIERQQVLGDEWTGQRAGQALKALQAATTPLSFRVHDWIISTEARITEGAFVSGRAYAEWPRLEPDRAPETVRRATSTVRYDS